MTEGKSPGRVWHTRTAPGASGGASGSTGPLPHLHPGPQGQSPAKGRQGHLEDHSSPHSGRTSRARPGFPGQRTGHPAALPVCRPGEVGVHHQLGRGGSPCPLGGCSAASPGSVPLTLTLVLGSRLAVSINSCFHQDLSADRVLPISSPGCTYPSRLEVGREPAVLGLGAGAGTLTWGAGGCHPPCARLHPEAPMLRATL